MTNFELLGFVPLGCITSDMTYYDEVVVKMMTPVVAIGLFSCPALYKKLRGQPNVEALRTVKRLAMLLLELSLPGITTSLIQVFLCSSFDNGKFLRESLTLACDDSEQRKFWVAIAIVGLVLFPVGGKSTCINLTCSVRVRFI